MTWILVLACEGSITLSGRPVRLVAVVPQPSAAPEEPAPPPPPPPRSPPPSRSSPPPRSPAPAAASTSVRRDDDREDDDGEDAAPAVEARPPVAAARFHRKPEPPEPEFSRLGRACYARKAAACRELALIHLHDPPDTSCGTYLTDDPNGPVGRPGHVEPACKPPTYRHLGPCGMCLMPTVKCEGDEGEPFGRRSKQCPPGTLCSALGRCFPRHEFPVEHHNLPRGAKCYLDRECASRDCDTNGISAYGDVGECT